MASRDPAPISQVGAEPIGAEERKKGRPERLKRCIRTAAGSSWEDPSLLEWDAGMGGGMGGLWVGGEGGEVGAWGDVGGGYGGGGFWGGGDL